MTNGAGFDAVLVGEGIGAYENNKSYARGVIFSVISKSNLSAVLEALPKHIRLDFEAWLLEVAKYSGVPKPPLDPTIREAILQLLDPQGDEWFDERLVTRGIEEHERNTGLACAYVFAAVSAKNLGAVLDALPSSFRKLFEQWLLDIARYPGTPIGWGKPLAADIREAALRLLGPNGRASSSEEA